MPLQHHIQCQQLGAENTNLPSSNHDTNTELFRQYQAVCGVSRQVPYLELHGGVLLILGGCVALVMKMVGSGWVDDGRLLGLPLTALAVHVNHKC